MSKSRLNIIKYDITVKTLIQIDDQIHVTATWKCLFTIRSISATRKLS